jgi:hypothetical protein
MMKNEEVLKEHLQVETISHKDTFPESYIDDWEFDEVW